MADYHQGGPAVRPAGNYDRHRFKHRPRHRRNRGGLVYRREPPCARPTSLFDSGRSMAVHFYILAREGLSMPNAYGTAAILIISILLINITAYTIMQRFLQRYS